MKDRAAGSIILEQNTYSYRGRTNVFVRSLGQVLLVLLLFLVPREAVAACGPPGCWSGFWTWESTPTPGRWFWTWVWTWSSGQGSSTDPPTEFTFTDFWTLEPENVVFSGLIATDFEEVNQVTPSNLDLALIYTGQGPLVAGEPLGKITLEGTNVTPEDAGKIGYSFALETTRGYFLGDGVVGSVPEAPIWALMLSGFAAVGYAGCRRNLVERRGSPSAASKRCTRRETVTA